MAFIYKITNKINGKLYIGKTEETVEKRFKQHLSECNKDRCKNRPLYRAIRKYGKENFEVSLIEETDDPCNREVFWIEFYESFGNGYNATKGGDGSSYVDKDIVIFHLINTTRNCSEVARLTGYDNSTCRKIAIENNLYVKYKVKGVEVYNSILTEELVLKIKQLYIPKKFGKRKIAKILNLPVDAVQHVITGRTWKHLI